MAIAFVKQCTVGGANVGNPTTSSATFGSNVTSGNTIVVIIREYIAGGSTISSVSDGTNTYSLVASDTSGNPNIWVYAAQNISGGFAPTITVSGTFPNPTYWWVWGGEYSGVASSSVDSGASGARHQTAGSTDLTSSAITTAGSGEAIVLGASQDNFTTYSAGTDFSLRSGTLGDGGSNQFGGVEDYVTSTTLSSYTAHLTSGITNQAGIAWVTLEPAGGGGITANISATEGADTAALNLSAAAVVNISATEAPDTLAFNTGIIGTANISATEADDTLAFNTNASSNAVANIAATEADDTLAFNLSAAALVNISATEAPDTLAFNTSLIVGAHLSATEAPDTLAFNTGILGTANISASEADDTLAFNTVATDNAQLSTTEAADTLAFNASVVTSVQAQLSATEAADTLAFHTGIIASAQIAATEADDTLSFVFGGSPVVHLAATEAPDHLVFVTTVPMVDSTLLSPYNPKLYPLNDGSAPRYITGELSGVKDSFDSVISVIQKLEARIKALGG